MSSLRRRLLQSSGLSLLDHFVKIGSVFVITPLMIAALGEETNGLWVVITSIFGYLALLDFGLILSGSHFAARAVGKKQPDEYFDVLGRCHRIYRRVGRVVLAFTVLFAVCAVFLPRSAGVSLAVMWFVIGIYGIVVATRFAVRPFALALRAHVRYELMLVPSIARTLLQMGLLWLVVKTGGGLVWLVIVFTSCEMAELVLMAWWTGRSLRFSLADIRAAELRTRGQPATELIEHTKSSFLTTLGLHLRSKLDPLIVGAVGGYAQVTLYSIGIRFIAAFEDVINALFGGQLLAAFSQIEARDGSDRLHQAFINCTRAGVMISTLGGTLILVLGAPFIERWMGAKFSDAYTFLLILTPAYILWMTQYPAFNLLYSLGLPQHLARLVLIGGACNAVVSIALAMWIGILGVAWGTALELYTLTLIVMPLIISRASRIPVWEIIGRVLGGVLLAAVPSGVFWLVARSWLQPNYPRLILAGALLTTLSLIWNWLVLFKSAERQSILRRLLKRKPTANAC